MLTVDLPDHLLPLAGWSICFEQEPIEATSMSPSYEPDPGWAHIDARGHLHSWALDSWEPELGPIYWCSDCRDEHGPDVERLVCSEPGCDETIRPGYRMTHAAGMRRTIAGPRRAFLKHADGMEIAFTGEEMRQLEEVGMEWLPELAAAKIDLWR